MYRLAVYPGIPIGRDHVHALIHMVPVRLHPLQFIVVFLEVAGIGIYLCVGGSHWSGLWRHEIWKEVHGIKHVVIILFQQAISFAYFNKSWKCWWPRPAPIGQCPRCLPTLHRQVYIPSSVSLNFFWLHSASDSRIHYTVAFSTSVTPRARCRARQCVVMLVLGYTICEHWIELLDVVLEFLHVLLHGLRFESFLYLVVELLDALH